MRFTLLFLIIFLCLSVQTNAQDYEFEELSGTYTELDNPNSLTGGDCWDEVDIVLNNDLPITEWFGNPVTAFRIQDSRIILGEITDGNLIAPFSTNLYCSGIDPSSSHIAHLTETGDQGEKIMKIEWKNTGFAALEGFFDLINFQVWIYDNGIIEFHYGPGETALAEISYEELSLTFGGLCGISNGIFDAYYLEGPSDAYSFKNGPVNIGNPPLLTSFPPSGTIYRFYPKPSNLEKVTDLDFNIFPSLAAEILKIEMNEESIAGMEYEIRTIGGQTISAGLLQQGTREIDIAYLGKGVYLLSLTVDNRIQTKKFIKI